MAAEINQNADEFSKRVRYVDSMVRYVKEHRDFESWDKDRAMAEIVTVMLNDIGAAQGFLDALGIEYDLYGERIHQVYGDLFGQILNTGKATLTQDGVTVTIDFTGEQS